MKKTQVGLGLRPQYYEHIYDTHPSVHAFEIISENFMGLGGNARFHLEKIRQGYPIFMHGVAMNIGATDPLNLDYLKSLKELIKIVNPVHISDHLCWSTHQGLTSHDLLPMSYTEETLEHLIVRVFQVQEFLGRRLLLENPSMYAAFKDQDMSEAQFLHELCRVTGCGLLLDINNLFVNQSNLAMDPQEYFKLLKGEQIGYFHLAGHTLEASGLRADTHDHPVPDEVWGLYRQAVKTWGIVPTVLEWDAKFPEFSVLVDEMEKARLIQQEVTQDTLVASVPPLDAQMVDIKTPFDQIQTQFFEMVTEKVDSHIEILDDKRPVTREVGLKSYQDGFTDRLVCVLADDFKTLKSVCGTGFGQLVRAYAKVYSPYSWSVADLGENLEKFLRENELADQFGVSRHVLADIAAFEWAAQRMFMADDESSVQSHLLGEVQADQWERLVLKLNRQYRLVETGFDVAAIYNAIQASEAPRKPKPSPGSYLFYRGDRMVQFELLSDSQLWSLRALEQGLNFKQICERLWEECDNDADKAPELVAEQIENFKYFFDKGMIEALQIQDVALDMNYESVAAIT